MTIMSGVKKAFDEIEEIQCEDENDRDAEDAEDAVSDDTGSEDENYAHDFEDEDPVDFGHILSNFFVTENGENVAEALMAIKKSIDTHNKILLKYVNKK